MNIILFYDFYIINILIYNYLIQCFKVYKIFKFYVINIFITMVQCYNTEYKIKKIKYYKIKIYKAILIIYNKYLKVIKSNGKQ